MIEPTNRAIILSNTSFAEIFRACGCRLAVELDLPVSSFVCLRGQIPTTLIAKALQQESAVMFLRQGRLVFWRVSELLKEPPLLRYDPSAVQWENNPVVLAKSKISFFSVALDGSTIERPTPTASRPVSYYRVLLTPIQASQFDLWTLTRMNDLVEQVHDFNPNLKSLVVLSRAVTNKSVVDTSEAANLVKDYQTFTLCDSIIRDRISYRRAISNGMGVVEYQPQDAKAIDEIEALYKEVFTDGI